MEAWLEGWLSWERLVDVEPPITVCVKSAGEGSCILRYANADENCFVRSFDGRYFAGGL